MRRAYVFWHSFEGEVEQRERLVKNRLLSPALFWTWGVSLSLCPRRTRICSSLSSSFPLLGAGWDASPHLVREREDFSCSVQTVFLPRPLDLYFHAPSSLFYHRPSISSTNLLLSLCLSRASSLSSCLSIGVYVSRSCPSFLSFLPFSVSRTV